MSVYIHAMRKTKASVSLYLPTNDVAYIVPTQAEHCSDTIKPPAWPILRVTS